MKVSELQAVLDSLVTRQGSGDHLVLECNWCSDMTYSDHLYNTDFTDMASSLLTHLQERHADVLKPDFEPVTQAEIDEVFGIKRPRIVKRYGVGSKCGEKSPYISQYGTVECDLEPGHEGEHQPAEHHRAELYSWD